MALRVLFSPHSNNNRICYGLIKRCFTTSNKDIELGNEPVISKDARTNLVSREKQLAEKARRETIIITSESENVGVCSGVPEEQLKSRTVRIYRPAKSAMQSGTNNINFWQLDFDTQERWENPLMGWTSTGDPLSNLQVGFSSKEEAIAYCDKMGWKYYVQKPNINNPKPRSYGTNFSWNKRTRVSTK
ncbi:NADH dehydrogenase [ubiquinone] iron-sulfur protein 4, mitochondrial [Anthophora plagiata]